MDANCSEYEQRKGARFWSSRNLHQSYWIARRAFELAVAKPANHNLLGMVPLSISGSLEAPASASGNHTAAETARPRFSSCRYSSFNPTDFLHPGPAC